jgi:hypothetical protein
LQNGALLDSGSDSGVGLCHAVASICAVSGIIFHSREGMAVTELAVETATPAEIEAGALASL